MIICEHLYDEDDIPGASKVALARLARTCKAFHAVALRYLHRSHSTVFASGTSFVVYGST